MGENGNSKVLPPTAPLTAEQAEKNFAKTQEESTKNLIASTSVTKDDKGQYHWMGMEVSEEMLPMLQYFASVAPQYLSDFLKSGVYDNSLKLFNKLNNEMKFTTAADAGHKAGLAGAATMTGLLIGLQPITEVVQSINLRDKKRTEIFKSLTDVMATNGDYKHNEVIQTALERSNRIFSDGVRRAFAELPTVAVNAIFAFSSHKELSAEKSKEFQVKQIMSGSTTIDGHLDELKKEAERLKDLEATKRKWFKKFETGKLDAEKNPLYKESDPKYIAAKKAWDSDEKKKTDEAKAKLKAEATGKAGEKPKETSAEMKMLGINAAAMFTQMLKSKFKKESADASKNQTAYELIIKLNADFENGHISQGSNITKRIIDIFKANEKDRGRADIGSVLVAKFEPLAKRIGAVISNGELTPLALVNLVGEGEVINHRRFVSEDDLEQIINKQRSIFSSHDKTSLEDFLADFTKPEAIVAVIKDSLKELKGKDRAVLASLLPDDVLFNIGIKKDEVLALRRAGHEEMYEFLKKEIVNLSQETEEDLEKRGLSKEQVSAIKAAAEKIEKGDEKDIRQIIEGSKDDKNNIVVSTVRKIELEEQISEPVKADCYWATKIKAQPRPKKIEEIIEDRETEQDIPKAEVIAHQTAQHGNSQHERLH